MKLLRYFFSFQLAAFSHLGIVFLAFPPTFTCADHHRWNHDDHDDGDDIDDNGDDGGGEDDYENIDVDPDEDDSHNKDGDNDKENKG